MNSTINLTSSAQDLNDLIYLVACGPTIILGILGCLICALIFSSHTFKQKKLFSYLKNECIFMLAVLATSLLPIIFDQKQWPHLSQTLLAKYVLNLLYYYLSSLLEMCAILSSIFASISCYSILDSSCHLEHHQNKNRCLTFLISLSPNKVTLGFLIASALTFVYQPFVSRVSDQNMFAIEFFQTRMVAFEIYSFMDLLVRDGLLLAILLVVNYKIGMKIRANLRNKMALKGGGRLGRGGSQSSNSVRETQKTNLTKMILADCANSTLGRLPILVYFLINNIWAKLETSFPFKSLCAFAIYLSFLMKLFLYYYFNKRFRVIFCRGLKSLLRIFRC
jgi:hypothetical protein